MWQVGAAIAAAFVTLWGITELGTYLTLRRIDGDREADW